MPLKDAHTDGTTRAARRTPEGRNRSGRVLGAGSLVLVTLVALLLLFPNVGAAQVKPAITHGPPFKGTLHFGQLTSTLGCGASAAFPVAPNFNLTTGKGGFSTQLSSKGCGLPGFSDNATTQAIFGFDSTPMKLAVMKTRLTINTSYNFSFNLSATPQNPVGGPFAWASASVNIWAVWYNLSAKAPVFTMELIGSFTTNSTPTGHIAGIYGGPFGGGLIKPSGITNNQDQYVLEIYVVATTHTHAPAGTSTHASARVNMATLGHYFRVYNWTLQ